jgi:hypothetical protein
MHGPPPLLSYLVLLPLGKRILLVLTAARALRSRALPAEPANADAAAAPIHLVNSPPVLRSLAIWIISN